MIEPSLNVFPPRDNCCSVALNDREILILGGDAYEPGYPWKYFKGIFTFDVESNRITKVQSDILGKFEFDFYQTALL